MININRSTLFYDKYAPSLLGVICQFTNDISLAEKIFAEAYIKMVKTMPYYYDTAFLLILKYFHGYAVSFFELNKELQVKEIASDRNANIFLLAISCHTKQAASNLLNVSEHEVGAKIRSEMLSLRKLYRE
ncbi:MAG: hypothetical protein ABI402_08220 [Ferruginibacter sp.]